MSAAPASGAAPTTKITDKKVDSTKEAVKPAPLVEDDEFEDFPVEGMLASAFAVGFGIHTDGITDWTQEETEVPGDNTHLWEESWDDDDTSEDFSAQLKYVDIWVLLLCLLY
jgi:26 proteasome complex subunit DSS1